MFISGPIKAYKYHFRIWPETLCQVLNVLATVRFIESVEDEIEDFNSIVKVYEVIIFIRLLKLLVLLYEVKAMAVIFDTIKSLIGPINYLFAVMLTIFYVFAQIGMEVFGGKVYSNSPTISHDASIPHYYYLCNFNDIVSAYVTLFVLIVVNNWYIIVDMYVDIMGNRGWRYFFILFYYFGVTICVNIIVSFSIDMYQSVSRLHETKKQNRQYLKQLAE